MSIEEMCAHNLIYELKTGTTGNDKCYCCGKCLESYVIRLCARAITTHVQQLTGSERAILERERDNAPMGELRVFNLDSAPKGNQGISMETYHQARERLEAHDKRIRGMFPTLFRSE